MRQKVVDLQFPLGGLNEAFAYQHQPPFTTPSAQNVRGWEPGSGRARGGSRPGLSLYATLDAGGDRVQDLTHITTSTGTSRTIKAVGVVGGTVKTFEGGVVATPTGGAGALSSSADVIFSAPHFQRVYFVDGTSYVYYEPATGTVGNWETLCSCPMPNNSSNKARLIELWRGRIALSGIRGDDHNYFFSAVGDATDWQYNPQPPRATQAFSGNNADLGKVGDRINSMLPWNDNLFLFFCDHSIYAMYGDPAEGGEIKNVSEAVGAPWGRPWCLDPSGVIYFFGNRGGLYRMEPGGLPQKITSNTIDERLADIDLSANLVRLVWDDRQQGVYVTFAPYTPAGSGNVTSYFFDVRNNHAPWVDVTAEANVPYAVDTFDGDDPDDRAVLFGTDDGRVLKVDVDATTDAGTAITSHVDIGPLRMGGAMQSMFLDELQGILALSSGDVTYAVRVGGSAEAAYNASAKFSGTWSATATQGRNISDRRRAFGDAMFIRLSSTSRWALESVAARLKETARQRVF